MRRKVVITGTGIVSPLGNARDELQNALCAGQMGIGKVEGFQTPGIEGTLAGEVAGFRAADYLGTRGLRPLNRTAQLLTVAAKLAIQDSGWAPEALPEQEVGLIAGTTFCSAHSISDFDIRALQEGPSRASPLDFANVVINAAAGQTALWHKLTGVNSTISAGNTSGLKAISYAVDMIRNGIAVTLLAGGVEELCYETLYTYYKSGLLYNSPGKQSPKPIPFDRRRTGFCLAEGAALLMLEEAESASARGANILGEIKGAGTTFDCHAAEETSGIESNRNALAAAIRMSLADAGVEPADIDAVSASASGEPRRDRAEAIALADVFQERNPNLPVTAIKASVGESLGASGAMQTVGMVAAMQAGKLPGIAGLEQIEESLPLPAYPQSTDVTMTHILINALGIDGNCCSLVVGNR